MCYTKYTKTSWNCGCLGLVSLFTVVLVKFAFVVFYQPGVEELS